MQQYNLSHTLNEGRFESGMFGNVRICLERIQGGLVCLKTPIGSGGALRSPCTLTKFNC